MHCSAEVAGLCAVLRVLLYPSTGLVPSIGIKIGLSLLVTRRGEIQGIAQQTHHACVVSSQRKGENRECKYCTAETSTLC